jgi:hypothetical protein
MRGGPTLADQCPGPVIPLTSFERSIQIRLTALREALGPLPSEGSGGEEAAAEIDAALHRLSEGNFGRCEACGRALGNQRLLAEPTARFCLGGKPCR